MALTRLATRVIKNSAKYVYIRANNMAETSRIFVQGGMIALSSYLSLATLAKMYCYLRESSSGLMSELSHSLDDFPIVEATFQMLFLATLIGTVAGLTMPPDTKDDFEEVKDDEVLPLIPITRESRLVNIGIDLTDASIKKLACPLTMSVMDQPRIASDGHTYEANEIIKWLKINNKSPVENTPLKSKQLFFNKHLNSQIVELIEEKEKIYFSTARTILSDLFRARFEKKEEVKEEVFSNALTITESYMRLK